MKKYEKSFLPSVLKIYYLRNDFETKLIVE